MWWAKRKKPEFLMLVLAASSTAIAGSAIAEMQMAQNTGASSASQADTQEATIAGVWNGTYYYPNNNPPVRFTFTFPPASSGCIGRSEETNTFGNKSAPKLYAILSCSETALHAGQTLTIRKTYDGTGGVSHTVMYTGKVSADLRAISGQWAFNAFKGTFSMSR